MCCEPVGTEAVTMFESLPLKRKAKFVRIKIGLTGKIESKNMLLSTQKTSFPN